MSYPVDALLWAALTTEAKTNVGRCVAYPNAIILEETNSPVRRLPKNAWIKRLDEPEKRKLGCRWQLHAVGPRSSLPHAAKVQFRRLFPMSPAILGHTWGQFVLGANESHIYPNIYVCNIWLRSDGRVERKGEYRHTDSWHEWLQDNFYGGSATKRIVIKEPSLVHVIKIKSLCLL